MKAISILAALVSLQLASLAEAEVLFRPEKASLAGLDVTLMVPRGHDGERLPALMVFGGFENAAHVLELVHPTVPVVLASFDYPYSAPRKFAFPGSLAYAGEVKRSVRRTISGIVALAQFLRRSPGVDPSRISILGASFGAPFALAAAARDPAIRGVIVVHGFGDVKRTAVQTIMRSWGPRYGEFARPLAWLIAELGWLYLGVPSPEEDTARLNADQQVLMISAESDSFIPREASDSLWRAIRSGPAGKTAERQVMPGDHLLPGADHQIEDILSRVTAWMKERGLLP